MRLIAWWLLLASLSLCLSCGPALPDPESAPAASAPHRFSPDDSTAALRHFWQQFQIALSQGTPKATQPYVHFPLYSFGMPITQAEFMTHYREVIWSEADSVLSYVRAEDLLPTDLTPYYIRSLDHPAGYSTLVSRRDSSGQRSGMVYFVGKVEGAYRLVGYASSAH